MCHTGQHVLHMFAFQIGRSSKQKLRAAPCQSSRGLHNCIVCTCVHLSANCISIVYLINIHTSRHQCILFFLFYHSQMYLIYSVALWQRKMSGQILSKIIITVPGCTCMWASSKTTTSPHFSLDVVAFKARLVLPVIGPTVPFSDRHHLAIRTAIG